MMGSEFYHSPYGAKANRIQSLPMKDRSVT
jgi:hypothetical protein